MKFNGELTFEVGEELINLDRLHSLNIGNLRLIFQRQVKAGELFWIRNLSCLDQLSLWSGFALPNGKLALASVTELEESF